MSVPRVVEIRRFPVKSMGGEALTSVELDARGLTGDRWFAVVDEQGRLASGKDSRRFRRRDAVFDHRAETRADTVVVHGPAGSWRVGDPALDATLTERMGDVVRVTAERRTPHHDAAPVSLVGTASLAWCREHLGVDGEARRLRSNLLVETEAPFVEESWRGTVRIGTTELAVIERIERCRMVDIAQEGVPDQRGWLRALGRERDLCLGIYLAVLTPGAVAVGDRVHPSLRPPRESAPR